MKPINLVCLKGNTAGFSVIHSNINFKPHKQYRMCVLSENDIIINGCPFTKAEFDTLFEYVLTRAKRHFEFLGLTVSGKPVSVSKFKSMADIHQYGKGKNMLNVLLFEGFDKDKICYAFYPLCKGDSKARCTKNAYSMFVDFLNGEIDDFDCEYIQFGNCGISVSYGDMRQRYVDTSKKLFI